MTDLRGKTILFGVTGSIAAYKAADWVRSLVKEEASVNVVLTKAAERFVSALTFTALSGNATHRDMFADGPDEVMAHINLSREADALIIAPATAQTMARLATGMADNLLSAVCLAARIPVLICPAMNTAMFHHLATQENIRRLRQIGYSVLQPGSGDLACGEHGDGRLPEWDEAREALLSLLTPADLRGVRVLITAGPTREALDPARYLSNRSSGKMGYALARTAMRRGALVTLVSGPVALADPPGVEVVRVNTAQEMTECVFERARLARVIVKAAAVADFTPAAPSEHKIKKSAETLQLECVRTTDILAELGRRKTERQVLVGFAAESRSHLEEGQRKLLEKNLDMIVVNDILGKDSGFDVNTNQVTIIERDQSFGLPVLSKESTADRIWDEVLRLLGSSEEKGQTV